LRSRWLNLAKWAWIAGVIVAACVLVGRAWPGISDMLASLDGRWLGLSIATTLVAKFLLGENARLAASRCGIELGYPDAFRLYNLSQLGKYLPGSIWQFVGRAAAYRHRGAAFERIRDALVAENVWTLAGAGFAALLFAAPASMKIITSGGIAPATAWWIGGLAALSMLAAAIALMRAPGKLRGYIDVCMPTPRVILVQGLLWTMMGAAFWSLANACGIALPLGLSIGLFGLAYAVGFLVPLAPAGLGVREAILTVGLLPSLPAAQAITVTLLARVVYVLVELALVALQDVVMSWSGRRRDGGRSAP